MKQPRTYFTKRRLIMASILLLAVALFLLHTRLFTISTNRLNRASAAYNVHFFNRKHSFDIVPAKHGPTDTGIIFYPGALVDARAYAPKLARIASTAGAPVFIAKPYWRLADINANAADGIMAAHPEVHNWYIGGHSMGGGAACSYARDHASKVRGLFLLAAYCSADGRTFAGPAVVLVGANDRLEPPAKVRSRVPSQAKIITINGANHSSFGNYGSQPFDGRQVAGDADIDDAITAALQNLMELPHQSSHPH